MKVSEITLSDISRQIREDETYLTEGDREYLAILQKAAVEYVKSYTGLDDAAIDTHEDITIAVLVLISDMFDNRQMTGQARKSLWIETVASATKTTPS